MSLMKDNVIPGNYGKVFGTNANEAGDLQAIREALLKLDGITYVAIDDNIFPKEFNIHTDKIVKIEAIEDVVKSLGFHAVPKSLFEL
ncbi:heavy-metal-associated domain-containing protein [Flavobacterium frigidarium]|uniref:heavy-metal-associated domain-containing protein n=1 Tax=Flavobacterium frigidarium TaxID=99286 RepID=UPI000420CED0|nr:heavy-metal-associated domain-containing protein [Flavobacterium frigidarium]